MVATPKIEEFELPKLPTTPIRRCFVYLVRTGDGFKIGNTFDPIKTLKAYRRICPSADLVLCWLFKNKDEAVRVENALQSHYCDVCVGGEVFDIHPADLIALFKTPVTAFKI